MKKLFITTTLLLTTLLASGQCLENRHSTNWFDGWISCNTSPNPISSYGNTHWIKYDLGHIYTIYKTKLWNSNDPSHLDYGIMNYNIDYSIDGNTWINLGSFTANQATGLPQYEGDFGADFNGASARYVIITPTSNYGGACYGFSEMMFNLDGTLSVTENELNTDLTIQSFPNPFNDDFTLLINTPINEEINYKVIDILGREVIKNTLKNVTNTNAITINTKHLITGIYFVQIQQGKYTKSLKIIKK